MKHLVLTTLAVVGLIACSKPKDAQPTVSIDNANVELNYDKTHQFNLTQGSTSVSASTYTWTSSDVAVGTIAPTGLFTAKRIGETTVTGTSGDKQFTVQSKVTVKPYSTAWAEPITTFGATKSSVKSKEKRTLSSEDDTSLIYEGESTKVAGLLYVFETNKLQSAAVLLQTTSDMVKESATFLQERYTYVGNQDGIYVFTDGKSVTVGLTLDDTLGLLAVYLPNTAGGRLSYEAGQRQVKTEIAKLRRSVSQFN